MGMNILYLGKQSVITDYLISSGNEVVISEESFPIPGTYDCIISYGYRHKIPMTAVNAVGGKAINLHISYLPYNRGANPNYWSWYDKTPKGVTIHYVDESFDTGDIIVQRLVDLPSTTLKDTYEILSKEIEDLFIQNWNGIFTLPTLKQGNGTSHTSKEPMILPDGWDTKCKDIGWNI